MLIKNQKDIGTLVSDNRQRSGITGAVLSDRAGTSQAMISRIEHGKANVTIQTLIRIAEALGKKLKVTLD